MKKLILLTAAASALMLASCDPDVDDIGMPSGTVVSESELDAGFSVAQYSDELCTVACDSGNYFKFYSSAVVTIYQVSDDETTKTLSSGAASGIFTITVSSSANVTYYVSTQGFDGSTITINRSAYVAASSLSAEMRILASDNGYRIWTWDTEFNDNGYVWGNAGYAAGNAGAWSGGIWWGATCDDDEGTGLVGQLSHSDTGVATGEELSTAYMVFYDDATIKTYNGDGELIRSSSTLSVSGYDGTYNQADIAGSYDDWCLGTLSTDAGSILFPFQINGGGTTVGDFELMLLDDSQLQLIYVAEGTGSWSECTWWAFKSVTADVELSNYDSKTWKWDTEFNANGYVWGNAGYTAGTYGNWSGGIWWGATCDDDTNTGLVGQLGHSDTGEETGEELSTAYMVFDYSTSTVSTYIADGTLLRSGEYSVENWIMGQYTQAGVDGTENYSMGTLSTSEPAIMFPFMINGGGTTVTDFEIVYLDSDQMQLVYAPEGTGNWSECTWWAFRAEDAFGSTSSDSDTSTDEDTTGSDSGSTDTNTDTDSSGEGSAEEDTDTDSSGEGSAEEDTDTDSSGEGSAEEDTDTDSSGEGSAEEDTDTDSSGEGSAEEDTDTDSSGEGSAEEDMDTDSSGESSEE